MGIAATGNWMFNFALGLFVPPAFKNISWKTFIVFGSLCMGAVIQFYFTYPETGGKSLEEVEVLFQGVEVLFQQAEVLFRGAELFQWEVGGPYYSDRRWSLWTDHSKGWASGFQSTWLSR